MQKKTVAHPGQVRQLLLKTMNSGFARRDERARGANRGASLHTYAAPSSRTGIPMVTLSFTHLGALVEEGAGHVEREDHRRQGP